MSSPKRPRAKDGYPVGRPSQYNAKIFPRTWSLCRLLPPHTYLFNIHRITNGAFGQRALNPRIKRHRQAAGPSAPLKTYGSRRWHQKFLRD